MQTRKGSLVETLTNILIGYWINFFGNMLILPLFGFQPTIGQTAQIGVLFTFLSIVRSYCLRRFYNWLGIKGYFTGNSKIFAETENNI